MKSEDKVLMVLFLAIFAMCALLAILNTSKTTITTRPDGTKDTMIITYKIN